MDWFIFMMLPVLALVFSKAEECYQCGSRKVAERSPFGTRGICRKCLDEGFRLSA